MLQLWVRLGEDQRQLRVVAERDPHLLPVDAPAALDLLGPGLQIGGVRAGVRLGQPEAAQRFPGAEARQPVLLLLLAAPAIDRGADQRGDNRHHGAHRRAASSHLLDDQAVGQIVHVAPAVLLGHEGAEEAHVGDLLDELGVEVLVAVVVTRSRGDLAVGELAGGLPDQPLLIG